jgi:Helicase C-terminal domain/DEAD/DEAH box helicase
MTDTIDFEQFLTQLNSSKFRHLWPAQAYVLDTYARAYSSKPDVAVDLPTGAGKTLIALLIAEAWRRESKTVAILSANKTLARQMLQESLALGIPAVLMEGKGTDIPSSDRRAYQRAVKVAIMNYWVYFNQNPIIDPANLLVMDDAHLAEHCLHSLYSVEISKFDHKDLFLALCNELQGRFPEYGVLTDAISSGNNSPFSSPPELLSFVDQVAFTDKFRQIVDASPHLKDSDLKFRWNRIRVHLNQVNIYLSLNSIWIRPYIYPLNANGHYAQASQRLYMSATIGEPSDISRRLGVRKIEKIPVPGDFAEKTSGRRLIVMSRVGEKNIPERLLEAILAALRIHPKSVWLCSSEAEALKFRGIVVKWLNGSGFVNPPTWILKPQGDEIDQFKKSSQGHLFVAGRFDGMDFHEDECRLVIITSLPRAINTQEEFISAYLRDSGFMRQRLNQRIVQALGRCNRSDDDYGVYILADQRFTTHFGRESNKAGLPKNIVAEIDMAQDMADIEIKELVETVQRFLNKDFQDYDAKVSGYAGAVPVRSSTAGPPDTSQEEVLGWTALFDSQNYRVASDNFEKCWNASVKGKLIEIGALHGYQWAKALYMWSQLNEPSMRDRSLTVLEDAINRGGSSSWFNRLRASLNRAKKSPSLADEVVRYDYAAVLLRAFDDRLEKLGTTGDKFERWCTFVTERLQSESHPQYQEGLELLGETLGYQASRPKYNSATDCLWRGIFGNAREVVTFEAKIEHKGTTQVVASDVGQAHNQLTRATSEYKAHGFTIRGTIVTHLTSTTPDADAALGAIRVIPKDAILQFWLHLKMLLSLYRENWSMDDFEARSASAQKIAHRIPSAGWMIRVLDSNSHTITQDELLSEWK